MYTHTPTESYDWQAASREMHEGIPTRRRRTVIGITGNFGERGCELAEGYFRSVLEAGGTPLVIPPFEQREALCAALDHVDALLLSGGGDLNPLFLGQEPSLALHGVNPRRDLAELLLIREAFDRQMPILGICRGAQLLAAALGGDVHQDLAEGLPGVRLVKHSQDLPREYASHTVEVAEGSLLRSMLGEGRLPVNSFHHQAVKTPGPHLQACAWSADGVIEAVESSEHKPILGVQWHPECPILAGDRAMLPIFRWLVNEAVTYGRLVAMHRHFLSVDSHCDTPMKFGTGEEHLWTLPRMCYGHLDVAVMVAYLPQRERHEEALLAATAEAHRLLDEVEEMADRHSAHLRIARTPADLQHLKQHGQKAVMLGIENGYAIGRDLTNIQRFRERGVVYMTLCHNGDNDLCDSARGQGEHGGLSPLGREAVREMNRVGMMVDLSHAAESAFWEVLELSAVPVVCSHSSCRALCDHPRNLTDEQMRALAQHGGVMQVTLYEGFLRSGGGASVRDAVAHIRHAVEVMGIEHVGIGTDFDGDGGVPGVAHVGELPNLTRLLLAEGFSEADLRLLWGENFLRVMRQCQTYPS